MRTNRERTSKPRVSVSIVAALVVLGTLGTVVLITAGAAQAASASSAKDPCAITVSTENLADNAVQTAINAYQGTGKTVCVGAGIFPEQLTISGSLTLKGAGDAKTTIEPNEPLTLNTYDYDASGGATSEPAAAIILVEGSSGDPTTGVTGVTIEDLEVNGVKGQSTFTSCSDGYFGVDFQASSGTLTSSTVTGIELPPADFGCQPGVGVYAYNGWFNYAGSNNVPDSVTISHTTVRAYDKNGITCDDPEETCTIASDTITGIGPTNLIGQNGIQVAFGGTASVTQDTVSGNVYVGSGSTNNWYGTGYSASGVLMYDPGTSTTVSDNTIELNQMGVIYYADGLTGYGYPGPTTVTISHNTIKESNGYGIVANGAPGGGDTVYIQSNTVDNEQTLNPTVYGAPGILVDTGTFKVTSNLIEGSSNATSEPVCGPGTSTGACTSGPSTQSLSTAAIQGASESSSNTTYLYIKGNSYSDNYERLATLGVNGGAVNVEEVS